MAQMIGADPRELRALAAQMRGAADELDGHSSGLTSLLGGIDWVGDFASRFMTDWSGGHRVRLQSTSQFIRDAAAELERNADEQTVASESGGSLAFMIGGELLTDRGQLRDAMLGMGQPVTLTPGQRAILESLLGLPGEVGDDVLKNPQLWTWFNSGVVRPEFLSQLGKIVGPGAAGLLGGMEGVGNQISNDALRTDLTPDERIVRLGGAAVTSGAVSVATSLGTAKAMAVAGGFVGGPVGVVAGAGVGLVIGLGVEQLKGVHLGDRTISEHVSEVGADLAQGAYHLTREYVEFQMESARIAVDAVSDTVDAAADFATGAADVVSDTWNSLWD